MTKKSRPVARCTGCGKNIRAIGTVNQKCMGIIDGRKCKGTFRSMIGPNDWKECPDCNAEGRVDSQRCVTCGGDGWLNIRQ